MRLALLGLLGALVAAALVLLASPYIRWVQERLHMSLLWPWRRFYGAVVFVVALLPAELSGVDVFGAADNTAGIVYVLGLIAGVSSTVAVNRRRRKRLPDSRD